MDLREPITGQLQGLRVMAVDDNPMSREILREQILSWGFRAATARDGRRALKLLDEAALSGAAYNVAIIDSDMPGMDGIELGKAIRANAALKNTVLMILVSMDMEIDL